MHLIFCCKFEPWMKSMLRFPSPRKIQKHPPLTKCLQSHSITWFVHRWWLLTPPWHALASPALAVSPPAPTAWEGSCWNIFHIKKFYLLKKVCPQLRRHGLPPLSVPRLLRESVPQQTGSDGAVPPHLQPLRRLLHIQESLKRRSSEGSYPRRRPLLGPSPGWKQLLPLSHLRIF